MQQQDAEILALQALAFVAGEPNLLSRFMALTGVDEATLKDMASDASFLLAVLEFLLANEPDLIAFCESCEIAPTLPARARNSLLGESRFED